MRIMGLAVVNPTGVRVKEQEKVEFTYAGS
jgi:hypothetical protein